MVFSITANMFTFLSKRTNIKIRNAKYSLNAKAPCKVSLIASYHLMSFDYRYKRLKYALYIATIVISIDFFYIFGARSGCFISVSCISFINSLGEQPNCWRQKRFNCVGELKLYLRMMSLKVLPGSDMLKRT